MNLTLFAGVLLAATMVTARGASLGEKIMQAVAKADEPDKAIREAARPASLDEKIMRAASWKKEGVASYLDGPKPDGFSDDPEIRYKWATEQKKICNDKYVVGPNYDEEAAFNGQYDSCLDNCGMSCNNVYRSSDLFSGENFQDALTDYTGVKEIDQCLDRRCTKLPPFDKCNDDLNARRMIFGNRKPARMPKECKNSPWGSPENWDKWVADLKAGKADFHWN